MNYLSLAISLSALAVSLYVYFKGPKKQADELKEPNAPRLPGARP
jgi:hypothetical protein